MKKIQNKPQATNTHKTILASIFAFIALSVLYLLVTASMRGTIAPTRDTQEQAPTSSQAKVIDTTSKDGMKTFRSDFMKIEFEYPGEYLLDVKTNSTTLKMVGGKTLAISKYGSMFNSPKEHVDDVIRKWKNKPTFRMPFVGDHNEGEILKGVDPSGEYAVIFFVKEYAVYQFETSDISLFTDLESIAKSFKILD